MTEPNLRQLAQQHIQKDKWWEILSRFIDVLRMNIFIIDTENRLILPPEEGRYGGRFLVDPSLDVDIHRSGGFIEHFEDNGHYLEEKNCYQLTNFAIPIKYKEDQTIAYMVIGPVILNKRLSSLEYTKLAHDNGVDTDVLLGEIGELRIVSNIMMNSILELLTQLVRECVDKSVKEQRLREIAASEKVIDEDVDSVISEVTMAVQLDELLATLLDSALSMTNSEIGSIMVLDDQRQELSIRVSRGLDVDIVNQSKLKIGEGIAGLAAKENNEFILDSEQASENNRIGHLLKRPEIKHSLVLPLTIRGEVFGVLNLSTKNEDNCLGKRVENLRHLTSLISSAF